MDLWNVPAVCCHLVHREIVWRAERIKIQSPSEHSSNFIMIFHSIVHRVKCKTAGRYAFDGMTVQPH